jgi:hypothetical protein
MFLTKFVEKTNYFMTPPPLQTCAARTQPLHNAHFKPHAPATNQYNLRIQITYPLSCAVVNITVKMDGNATSLKSHSSIHTSKRKNIVSFRQML